MRDVPSPDGKIRRKLETWGEIAAYLNVEIRTAQRWEKRMHLPVRRLDGTQAVYAFADELDTWRGARERRPEETLIAAASEPDLRSTNANDTVEARATVAHISATTSRVRRRRFAIGLSMVGALAIGAIVAAALSSAARLTSTDEDTFDITNLSPAAGSVAFGGSVEPEWGVYVDLQYSLMSRDAAWLCIVAEVEPSARSGSVCGDPVRLTRGTGTARTRVIVTNTTLNGPVLTKRLRLIAAADNDCRRIPGTFGAHDASCFSNLFFERVHDAEFAWTHPDAANRVGVLAVSVKPQATILAETDVRVTVSYLLQDAPRAPICIRPVTAAPLKQGRQQEKPAGPQSRCSKAEVLAGFGTTTVSFAVSRNGALPVSTAGLWIEMKGLYTGYHALPLNWTAPTP